MVDLPKKHPFEDYPREDLNQGVTRRQLLSTLATELRLFSKKDEGLVGIKLSNLGALPDDLLREFIPAIIPGTQISVEDNAVWALSKGAEKPLCLFKLDPISTFTFNRINGRNTLGEIAGQLAAGCSMPPDRAFSIARGMFLTFVKLGVCLPTNNPSAG